MVDAMILIKEDYKAVCQRYREIVDKDAEYKYEAHFIVCHNAQFADDDVRFEDRNGWCQMSFLNEFAEEILLELSNGKRLLYLFSEDSRLDCEFLVIDKNKIIRKKYLYFDMPELEEDAGRLKVENENAFLEWNDIDYFMEIAKQDPDRLFEV